MAEPEVVVMSQVAKKGETANTRATTRKQAVSQRDRLVVQLHELGDGGRKTRVRLQEPILPRGFDLEGRPLVGERGRHHQRHHQRVAHSQMTVVPWVITAMGGT